MFVIPDLCLAGVKLTVFRGRSSEFEVITVATVDNLLRTEGPVVAFHGLLQNTQPCIARLGGFQLLHSSELPSELFNQSVSNHARVTMVMQYSICIHTIYVCTLCSIHTPCICQYCLWQMLHVT